MLRTMFVLCAFVIGNGLSLPMVQADEPAKVRFNAVLVDDVNSEVPSGKTPENAPRLELVGSSHFAFVDAGPQSKYWIGLGCELATDALKSQLGLTEQQALLVTMVAENSPAKTAGFQEHDVITTVKLGEESQPLDSVATLTKMVIKAEQKPLVLSVVRQGKPRDLTVTPMERPQPKEDVLVRNVTDFNIAVAPPGAPANPERVQLLLRELQTAISGQPQPTTIHFTGPVVAPHPVPAPPGVPHIVVMTKAQLPDDVTVTISKTGKEPVRIQYRKGESNSWGATETEIHTLPPEGRSAVQAVLSALHHVLPPASGALSLAISGNAGSPPQVMRSDWPVPFVHKIEPGKNEGGHRITKEFKGSTTATATIPPPKKGLPEDAAGQLQALEKRTDLMQKQLQELIHMTKQQDALRKELQSLRETLEKINK